MTGRSDEQGGPPRLTSRDLATRTGVTVERVEDLVRRRVLQPAAPEEYVPGDIHRIRVIAAFEEAGVPLEALVEASDRGRVSFAYYDQLHQPAGPPSPRTYSEFRASVGELDLELGQLFTAFGLAEPDPGSHMSIEDETFVRALLDSLLAVDQPDLVLRFVRLFGESTRRATEATLGVYGEAVTRLGAELAGLPPDEEFERVFLPWSRLARAAPALASWLTGQHLSRAIDAYSVEATEAVLEEGGFIGRRPDVAPAVAFVDLTGFTRLTEERGDEAAARVALRLAEVAGEIASRHRGRLVKLLGDGVLMRFPDSISAVAATLELLAMLPDAGLPAGHAGVHQGPLIARDGDVFGRTVNLAARVGDAARAGELYVTQAVATALEGSPYVVTPVGPEDLQGIGAVQLLRVLPADYAS